MGKSGSPRVCTMCQNRSSITDTQTDDAFERITYHRFPANPQRLDQWLELCGLSKDIIPTLSYKFICSNHFEPDCFERDLRAELLYGTKRMALKKDALPTIRTPKQQLKRKLTAVDSCEEDDRQKRKEQVDKLLNGETPVTEEIVNPFRKRASEDSSSRGEPDKSDMTQSEMLQRIEQLEQETADQRIRLTQLQGTIDSKTEKINFAKAEMVNAAISLQELKDHENRHVNERIAEILSGRFGEGQLATIMAGSSDATNESSLQVLWTEAELVQALKLRCISTEAYTFVRQQMRYPLPEVIQVERWIHGVYLETGHNSAAFRILQIQASYLKDIERICTLNLLHINTPVRYQYDSKRDQLIGPSAQLHCLTVQGLFSPWQQIVHIDFDLIVSREMVEKIITDLHHIDYRVVAITTDCEHDTGSVWRTLNVSNEQHYIRHPVMGHSIYLYACPDRTLVAIHRALIEEGFLMQENNLLISNATLMPVLLRHSQGGTIYERYLSREILPEITWSSSLSREFISSTTTHTLRMFSNDDGEGSDLLSTLTTLFDLFIDWYELCTSTACSEANSELKQNLITKLPYGACEDEQNIVLDGMFDVMETIRCADLDYDFLPQAILTSINSIRKLLADLRATYPGQIGAIPMLRMSTIPMKETILTLQESFRHASSVPSVNDILIHLCMAVASAEQDSHATNTLLKLKGRFSGECMLKSLRREDDPHDPDLPHMPDQKACNFLTHLAVARLGHKYDYLGEQTVAIEQKNDQYGIKPSDGDIRSCVRPSAVWTEQAKRLESYLCREKMIETEKKPGLAAGLIDFILGRHPHMGRDLVELYVRKRIAIKVQALNCKLNAAKPQTTCS